MLAFETSKSNSEVSKSISWNIISLSNTTSLQREPFLTIFYTINLSQLLVTKKVIDSSQCHGNGGYKSFRLKQQNVLFTSFIMALEGFKAIRVWLWVFAATFPSFVMVFLWVLFLIPGFAFVFMFSNRIV